MKTAEYRGYEIEIDSEDDGWCIYRDDETWEDVDYNIYENC